MMATTKVLTNNNSQIVQLPDEAKFDDDVKLVTVRIVGKERILSPVENSWDSFFNSTESVSDDFINDRAGHERVASLLVPTNNGQICK